MQDRVNEEEDKNWFINVLVGYSSL